MSLEDGKTEFVSHEIYCPYCRIPTGIALKRSTEFYKGVIHCACTKVFVYEVTTTYTIVTAKVNEFKNN